MHPPVVALNTHHMPHYPNHVSSLTNAHPIPRLHLPSPFTTSPTKTHSLFLRLSREKLPIPRTEVKVLPNPSLELFPERPIVIDEIAMEPDSGIEGEVDSVEALASHTGAGTGDGVNELEDNGENLGWEGSDVDVDIERVGSGNKCCLVVSKG